MPDPHNANASAAFLVEVLGLTLGAFSAIRGLEAQVELLEYREGGINDVVHRLPGAMHYPNLVLSGGMTSRGIVTWFEQTRQGAERHTLTVTLFDSAGAQIRAWSFAEAFPVRWTGPVLASGDNAATGEELEIAHAGMTTQ